MLIGVPKEIKVEEYRVGLIPNSVKELVKHGHQVMVESNAGGGIGYSDELYIEAGAEIVATVQEVFHRADMIVKVKEPQPNECKMLREGQILFTYLHLAPDVQQTDLLLQSGCVAIAYETVTDAQNRLPLLAPMSEVAGRMATQIGAHYLQKPQGGSGILLGGVPGVKAGKVVVIGAGSVGTEAIKIAVGLGAHVTAVNLTMDPLRRLDRIYGSRVNTICSTTANLEKFASEANLLIGAVLVPGAAAPKLITRQMIDAMRPGSVIVDVCIDQGGCAETSRATTHSDPVYKVNDVIHYCVANMPGALPLTSTKALNNVTLPFVIDLANKGYKKALLEDKHLMNGLNIYRGNLTYEAVARDQNKNFVPAQNLLNLATVH